MSTASDEDRYWDARRLSSVGLDGLDQLFSRVGDNKRWVRGANRGGGGEDDKGREGEWGG